MTLAKAGLLRPNKKTMLRAPNAATDVMSLSARSGIEPWVTQSTGANAKSTSSSTDVIPGIKNGLLFSVSNMRKEDGIKATRMPKIKQVAAQAQNKGSFKT